MRLVFRAVRGELARWRLGSLEIVHRDYACAISGLDGVQGSPYKPYGSRLSWSDSQSFLNLSKNLNLIGNKTILDTRRSIFK